VPTLLSCVPNVASVSGLPILQSLLFSFNFIYNPQFVPCLVYLMSPVSLDCPFSSATLVFFQFYLQPTICPVSCLPNVASVSGLSILQCHSCFLSIFIYNPLFVPCLVCLMLPVSLACTFSSATLVFFQFLFTTHYLSRVLSA